MTGRCGVFGNADHLKSIGRIKTLSQPFPKKSMVIEHPFASLFAPRETLPALTEIFLYISSISSQFFPPDRRMPCRFRQIQPLELNSRFLRVSQNRSACVACRAGLRGKYLAALLGSHSDTVGNGMPQ